MVCFLFCDWSLVKMLFSGWLMLAGSESICRDNENDKDTHVCECLVPKSLGYLDFSVNVKKETKVTAL